MSATIKWGRVLVLKSSSFYWFLTLEQFSVWRKEQKLVLSTVYILIGVSDFQNLSKFM